MLWGCGDQGLWLEGRSAWVRYGADGNIQRAVLGGGGRLITPAGEIQLGQPMDHAEAAPSGDGLNLKVISSSPLTTSQPASQPAK